MKLLFLIIVLFHLSISFAQPQVYIVYLGGHAGDKTIDEIEHLHHSLLSSVKGSTEEAKASLVQSYKRVINGFSAVLTSDEAAKISYMEGVLSVFKSEPRKMATTRSWDFVDELSSSSSSFSPNGQLGMQQLLSLTSSGKDVIIGVIDSGVWPESESFSDEGMEPVPERFKGTCEEGQNFMSSLCNRKLVGARYFLQSFEKSNGPVNTELDFRSPRDSAGHGTHTASTAGGRRVPSVSFPGELALGSASGGAPHARIAVYKACWQIGFEFTKDFTCFDDDLLAAFDNAIADGVDVLSVSIFPGKFNSYLSDAISIGAWHAFKNNVVVVACAGNSGPEPSSVVNLAPWIITVGASSIDRSFSSPVMLGNGNRVEGQSLTSTKMNNLNPLIFAGDYEIPYTTNSSTTGQCNPGTLNIEAVQGKIVLCFTSSQFISIKALTVKQAGGVGVIIQSPMQGMGTPAEAFLIPATVVSHDGAFDILNYYRSNRFPTAIIYPAQTTIHNKPAPIVGGFSSIGPNNFDLNILKPDIVAPGLSILAAWTEGAGPTDLLADQLSIKYSIDYGTSMSTPHVAAAAALVKAAHPVWSTAAIRSALMTTAGQTNNQGGLITNQFGDPATPFEMGAGHFQPTKAINPGLVYDANSSDYFFLICKSDHVASFENQNCNDYDVDTPSTIANSPSLAANGFGNSVEIPRVVTNVGNPTSVYTWQAELPDAFTVEIDPPRLEFQFVGQKKQFTVRITRTWRRPPGVVAYGWYAWSDGVHFVRSPIVVS